MPWIWYLSLERIHRASYSPMQTRGGKWTERFQRLRDHLAQMVLFAVNTGSRTATSDG